MSDLYTLYAVPHSMYSGRARSYLIKRGIAFEELSAGHPSFKEHILPKAKQGTLPALCTPDGDVIRDGAAIIEYFEAQHGRPSQPAGQKQRVISALFDLIGAEGLLRPAMHYRWSFPDENLAFLKYHFLYSQREHPEREARTDAMMDKMRMAGAAFGVSEESAPLVESLYEEFLAALEAHLAEQPYLLGWQPCIGDYGLITPMYAHLGRDPKPLSLMQAKAIRVLRWTERMNRQDQDVPEFYSAEQGYLPQDEIPDSLIAVLRVIAEDLVPETRAAADCINEWLAQNKPQDGQKAERFVGMANFEVRGQKMTAVAQPYRFFMLQRVQEFYAHLEADNKTAMDDILAKCGLAELMDIRLSQGIRQEENLEVWCA
jgi:glutathione S-transferase